MKRRFLQLRRKRGSMITEAAVFLPFFIIAAVTMVSLGKACWIDSMAVSTMENLLKQSAVSLTGLEYIRGESALRENGGVGAELCIWKEAGARDYEEVHFCCDTMLHLPGALADRISLKNALAFRSWEGRSLSGSPLDFSSMQRDETGNTVCVFPRAGGKYHDPDCRYVRSCGVRSALDQTVMQQYRPCPLCTDGTETEGTRVYLFPSGGSYHRQQCSSVTRYVIEIDRQDALCKGYSACSVCGGS